MKTNGMAKSMGIHFWRYFIAALLSPIKRGLVMERHHFINGVIVFFLYSFLSGLNTYVQTLIYVKPFQLEDTNEHFSFFSMMILPFLFTTISLFIIAGMILIIALLMRSSVYYPEVVARLGALLVIPTVFSLLLFILNLANSSSILYFLVSLLSMIGLFAAISFTVYSFYDPAKSGLDPFYAVLLTFIGIGFLISLFQSTVFTGFFSFFLGNV